MNEVEDHLNWAIRFHNIKPDNFLAQVRDNTIRNILRSIIVNYIEVEKFSSCPITSIMEIGFGSGYEYKRLEQELNQLKVRYVGVDYTKSFVDAARINYPDVWWVWGDVRNLEFKDSSMDLIFLCHVLEHQKGLPDLEKAIHELCRVSKSVVIILWFSPPSLINKTAYFMDGDFFVYKYNIKDVASLIFHNGFMIKEIYWQNTARKNNCLWVLEKREMDK